MDGLVEAIDTVAADTQFSGVVRVDRGGGVEFQRAYGLASRAHGIANSMSHRFGIASGTKGLTALTVVSLIEEGQLDLDTRARALLGQDLPLVGDDVTIEHLLSHRSGIGDYIDEEGDQDTSDYVLPVPVHRLAHAEAYLEVLDGFVAKSRPGEMFSYNNSGYVVLALIAERAAGVPFADLVAERVCRPAGMGHTAFLRSDELPDKVSVGYLDVDADRTNVLHLPVRGSGDGGIYTTVEDVHAFWAALFGGRIVSLDWVGEMTRPRSEAPVQSMRYGLGFWLHESNEAVLLEGCDAGVSFRTLHDPTAHFTYTVISNTSNGAWPLVRRLEELLVQ